MRIVSISALVLVLAACGGGSDSVTLEQPVVSVKSITQPFAHCLNPVPIPGVYKSTSFDVRRDDIGKTADGHDITSLYAVKLMIDRARCVGFDTAIFQTNIPIDVSTGKLRKDQPLPKDFWKYIEYAESMGMRTGIKPIPVDGTNDFNLNMDTAGLNVLSALESIKEFEVDLAKKAHAAGVDIFYVGVFQYGIDTEHYRLQWEEIVNSVREVYQGKLAYSNCWQCDNVVWEKVDIVAAGGDLGWINKQRIQDLETRYQKPVIVDEIQVMATPPGFVENALWDFVLQGIDIVIEPNYEEQQRRFDTLFAVFSDKPQGLAGFLIGEYMPWIQNSHIQEPLTNIEHQFKKFDTIGHSLYNNINAQTAIQAHLSKLWR